MRCLNLYDKTKKKIMKNASNFQTFLIFFLVLVVLFWVMPDTKIETIGSFFEKILYPIGLPLSIVLIGRAGSKKVKKFMKSKKDKSP